MITIAAANPHVAWMGRTSRSGEGAVTMAFPGVGLSVRTDATRIALRVQASTPDCHLNVTVDDREPIVLRPPQGDSELVLADGLVAGMPHLVRVVRRTESWVGVMTVRSIHMDGDILPCLPAPSRRLMFIGDSITCGACVEQLPPDWPEGHCTANAERSFGMELGRRIAAEVHLVSYGGRGVIRDWQGLGNDQIANAPVFFERALPDDAQSVWDHAGWQPDAVVIGLGTNDFNQGIPDERIWTTAYDAFLARIRAVHPQAWILVTSSPMFGARVDNGDAAKAAAIAHYLDEVVLLRHHARDYRVDRVLYRHHLGSSKNAHPTAPQHLLMADDLEPVLRARLSHLS
jgi:lysophospholipase L1-like esterase